MAGQSFLTTRCDTSGSSGDKVGLQSASQPWSRAWKHVTRRVSSSKRSPDTKSVPLADSDS
eukprot:CAMPEP_0115161886 /NCGR_PEP_ID=MMETSP0227-20121206/71659_1 /TAXON_ID=89957 /ORGANISM="Polarella glacialis, Strain CCMP 1383" /LENGTH=60 /DNA_ID=CAMNT_0002574043 /DNA_START=221 /DNA_END=400 /DNA_ORIENTATION=-